MINEFSAKKLGEVLAFCRIGLSTIDQGNIALTQALGMQDVKNRRDQLTKFASEIEKIATEAECSEITIPKADKTEAKLASMRELYVGDEWDNAAELLEWSGFYDGAAIVHWALVQGVGDTIKNPELTDLAHTAMNFHDQVLKSTSNNLQEVGQTKSIA